MTDQDAKPGAVPPPVGSPAKGIPSNIQRGPTIHIAEEFGTAKRNLPPVKVLLSAVAGVLA
ncbi:MAG: hypothetical protein WBX10_22505, partial [Candidatus Sulfotelmatobacter sp.]